MHAYMLLLEIQKKFPDLHREDNEVRHGIIIFVHKNKLRYFL